MKKTLYILIPVILLIAIISTINYRQKNRGGLKLIDWNTEKSKIVKFSVDGKTFSSNLDSLKVGEGSVVIDDITINRISKTSYGISTPKIMANIDIDKINNFMYQAQKK